MHVLDGKSEADLNLIPQKAQKIVEVDDGLAA